MPAGYALADRPLCRRVAGGHRPSPAKRLTVRSVLAVFVLYLAVIATGIVLYTILGLVHH
jgi:hypothetical protein